MDKIKIQRPLWIELSGYFSTISFVSMFICYFACQIYEIYYADTITQAESRQLKTILLVIICINFVGLGVAIPDFRFYRRVWLRVKQANGQECPGCQYPGTVEVGGKCTECGMDFTAEIVERWRQWWSADSMPPTLPASGGEWWAERFRAFVLRPIRKLRQTRLSSPRGKSGPDQSSPNHSTLGPPTPDAPPPPQPDPHAPKTVHTT